MCNYLGLETAEVAFVGALTGVTTEVKVRRAVVDARYLEPTIPSRHMPSFAVDTDVRCVSVNELPDVKEPATGYTIIGAGKTGSDACTWLLENGVDPDHIRWVRARDAWMWTAPYVQPLELVADTIDEVARCWKRRRKPTASTTCSRGSKPTVTCFASTSVLRPRCTTARR